MHADMDVLEKPARKRDLHALMDARAEARRMRKLQKQRSKEIGALLDFKMHSPMSPMEGLPPLVGGKGWNPGQSSRYATPSQFTLEPKD